MVALYGLLYILGVSCNNVKYISRNTISQVLLEPVFPTLEDICPICFHFNGEEHQEDHCYKCGCCV